MRALAAALFALWLATAYMLVYARADARHKGQVIETQRAAVEGARAVASQVLDLYNGRRGR